MMSGSDKIARNGASTHEKKANILFVNLPAIPYIDVENYLAGIPGTSIQLHGEPLGILYISSYLKKYGNVNKVSTLDYALDLRNVGDYKNCEDFILKLAYKKVDFTPDIIGLSINFTCAHRFLVKSAKILKSIFPKSIMVVGGFHATSATKELLDCESIDYVFRGEGEISFTKFVDCFNKGLLAESNIKGIYNREKLHAALKNPVNAAQHQTRVPLSPLGLENSESAENLDLLPFPDRTIIEMNQYSTEQGRATILSKTFKKRKASIITNRGCYFQCSFCASRTVFARKMRFRSTENVLEEMKQLHKDYGSDFFIIEDDLFTGDQQKCLEFLRETKKLDIEGLEIQFPNDLNINTTNEEIFDAMIGAGLKVAHLAVESGSEYVQKYIIKKRAKLEKVKPHVQYLQSKGIVVKCIYILGFPGETLELMQTTIDFARDIGADWSLFNIATPLLGTPMFDQFVERGDIEKDINMLTDIDFKYRSFDTKEISAKDLNALQYRSNLDINFIHNRHFLNGNYRFAISIYEEIVNKYPFHIIALACMRKCYRKLNDPIKYSELTQIIRGAVESNPKAKDMLYNYGDIMPELSEFMSGVKR